MTNEEKELFRDLTAEIKKLTEVLVPEMKRTALVREKKRQDNQIFQDAKAFGKRS